VELRATTPLRSSFTSELSPPFSESFMHYIIRNLHYFTSIEVFLEKERERERERDTERDREREREREREARRREGEEEAHHQDSPS